jgi:hypothetical protein
LKERASSDWPRHGVAPRRAQLSRRQILALAASSLGLGLLSACQPGAVPRVTPAPTIPPPAATPSPTRLPAALATPTGAAVRPTPTAPSPASVATIVPTADPTSAASSPTALAIVANPERLQPNGPPHDPGPLDWAHPGPHVGAAFNRTALSSFTSAQPLVTTYYFYWDDLTDPARREANRKYHPVDQDHYTFLSAAHHCRQFADMQAAGIDFALPVYWGEPGHPGRLFNPVPGHDWSTEGIPPMVEALDALAATNHPFKVGMFYDTTIMANADLTTENGKAYFYVNVRDYFSRIPPRHWAAIDGKPVVWLYDAQWVSRFDQTSFDDLATRFAADFGGVRPYIVREWQWYQSKGVDPSQVIHSDNLYGWGAALSGYNSDARFGVAEVGPGFDTTGDCGGKVEGGCQLVDRAKGAPYIRQLTAALASGRKILAVETWNEFDEGTGIAETIEFGRTYINLTRRYADAFHGKRPRAV